MLDLEEAVQKRKDAQLKQADEAKRQELLTATGKIAQKDDIDSLIKQVKEVQLAAMLSGSKPSVVLTDQTDLGDKMAELGDKLSETVAKLNFGRNDAAQLKALQDLQKAIASVSTALKTGFNDTKQGNTAVLEKLLTAIQALETNRVITVDAPAVDLKPLENTLKEYFVAPEVGAIHLESYRAQDISETDKYQYVGFVNPDGAWYIIENDITGNSLRYLFGKDNYSKYFAKASTYEYKLLNEAVNEA